MQVWHADLVSTPDTKAHNVGGIARHSDLRYVSKMMLVKLLWSLDL